MACIDRQNDIDRRKRDKLERSRRQREEKQGRKEVKRLKKIDSSRNWNSLRDVACNIL